MLLECLLFDLVAPEGSDDLLLVWYVEVPVAHDRFPGALHEDRKAVKRGHFFSEWWV